MSRHRTWRQLFRSETRKILRTFSQPTFIYLTIVGNVILLSAVTAIYWLEVGTNPDLQSYFDCLWWGVSTITTVAYGDKLPMTVPGRIIAMALMYTGTVLFITFTGVIMTVIMKEEVERELNPLEHDMERTLREIRARLDRLPPT